MEVTTTDFVFQADSQTVLDVYNNQGNYLIVNDEQTNQSEKRCAIYFSSNDIYFPNSEEIFRKRIVEKNSFEWYNLRIKSAQKHIFIRDIIKQWYLTGINKTVDTPERLFEFLKKETTDFKVVTVGSSAGGFAAVLFGSLLNAEKIFTFNGQFEINSLLKSSDEKIDPILFRNRDRELRKFYDLKSFINTNVDIYYFYSHNSKWDYDQYEHIRTIPSIKTIAFKTSHHGIPFPKCALEKILNNTDGRLKHLTLKKHNPILFSINQIGVTKTIVCIINQIINAYKKRR